MAADRHIEDAAVAASEEGLRLVRGGRKALPATEKRSERFTIRTTLAERAQIETAARSVGMTPSDYMRARALGFTPKTSPAPDMSITLAELNRIVLELKRVGNNVNQLAKSVHLDTGFQQYWREVGQEVKTLTSTAHNVLARMLSK